MKHKVKSVLIGALTIGLGLSAVAPPAHAAAAIVNNGLSTTDLNAVGMNPSALASALVGPGVSVSNVTYSGANAQAGSIHLVDPAVASFNDGIILSSGNISDVVGPNKSDGITGDMAGPADPDLNTLIANTQTVNPVTFDAASLEFDFVPTASSVYFTYTFGSDEYLEWVNLFNDVFAFFVNGQNCATVPSGSPVSIDTINSAVNPTLFRDNSFSSPPANPINIESDGLSVELICSASVNAGQTNHMKLAIADTSDQILDSVVMIKAHSLSTTKPESCNDGVDNDDDLLVDMNDDSCTTTTTAPPVGSSGIGSSGTAPAFTGNEGTAIPLDASVLGWTSSSDTISTTWTVTGINGTPGSCDISPAGPQPLNNDGSVAVVTAMCPNEGEYVARVDGTDIEGKSSWDTDVDFFVHNAPPAITLDAPPAAPLAASNAKSGPSIATAATLLGTATSVSATVVDPGLSDTVTCDIAWGDGNSEAGLISNGTCTGTHTYGSVGDYVVTMTATDNAGDSSATAKIVSITAVAPPMSVALTTATPAPVTGQAVTLDATVTDTTAAGPIKGKVTFFDGTTVIGMKAVSSTGIVHLVTTKLALGTHSITASWKRTTTSTAVVSDPQVIDVARPATTVAVKAPVTGRSNRLTTVRAKVSVVLPGKGKPAGGTVTFYDGETVIGTVAVTTTSAILKTMLTVGTHNLTAVYSGSSSLQDSPLANSVTITIT